MMAATRTALPVLLDLDGTISDNYTGIARSIGHALESLGAPAADAATLRSCVGPPLRDSFRRLLATDDAARIERAITLYRERYADVGWRENVVYPGIAQALPALSRVRPLFLCTAKPLVYARRIIERFGFTEYFVALYGTDLAGTFDDKSALVAHLAAEQGFAPASAVMIGDRANDIRAAHRNGARAIGVLWGYGSREELGAANALVTHPDDLCTALDRL